MSEVILRRDGSGRTSMPELGPRSFAATSDQLVLAAGLFWTVAVNQPFLAAALRLHAGAQGSSWSFVLGLGLMLASLHVLLAGLVCSSKTVKPILALLTIVAAIALYFTQTYGVVLDPSMLRNALHTDFAETRELLSWRLVLDLLLYAGLPIALLAFARVPVRPWRSALKSRALLMTAALGVFAGTLLWQFQPLASAMRNHKEMRYLITPANALWSLGTVLVADARGATSPRQPIGLDAAPGPSWAAQTRPRLLVLVIGETVRGANWGLSGYARQTTPRLAQLPVLNFTDVSACGTSTEVSLPCMFAPVGRRDYDEARIRGSESLLHVLARAGVVVQWRDNQSGCKGVCAGLPTETVSPATAPGLCQGDRCWDEGLLRGLDARLQAMQGVQVLVLHMLGNHGPSYFRRYPAAFERFTPACHDDDLGRCSTEQIVNAYDNALLYTDHVLASLIGSLDAHAATVDSAMLFVSDHGESLGEKGLFLHGMPNPIAPREQTQVPMLMWWSSGFAQSAAIDRPCMQRRTAQPAQHDHLFHTVLGLLDVRAALYEPRLDLSQGCRNAAAAAL
jgi:lipid A ethanolaminephosphotransferase